MIKILIVEDERDINELWVRNLSKFGYIIDSCFDGKAALKKIEEEAFDIIILDIMIPEINGYQVCRQIKTMPNPPYVILLSSLSTGEDVAKGFELQADDYVKKPCSILELKSRLDNIKFSNKIKNQAKELIIVGRFTLDKNNDQILKDNRPIELTKTEYKIMKFLFKHYSNPVSKPEIQKYVWNLTFEEDNRILEIYIHKIRQKLGKDAIQSIRSKGYVLNEKQ